MNAAPDEEKLPANNDVDSATYDITDVSKPVNGSKKIRVGTKSTPPPIPNNPDKLPVKTPTIINNRVLIKSFTFYCKNFIVSGIIF